MSNPSPHQLPEITLAGFLKATLGLGETGRLLRASLQSVGVPVLSHTYEKLDVANLEDDKATQATPTKANTDKPGISLLSLNGDHLSGLYRRGGRELFINRYVISVWFWETEDLPESAHEGFKYVDEIWAATPFIKSLMEKANSTVPVSLYNHPIIPISATSAQARERYPFDNRFVFLFTFDYNSCVKRKNPQAVCEAFVSAFPEPTANGPLCVVKSINGDKHGIDFNLAKWKWAGRPDIIFLDGFLSSQDRDLLVMRADAAVSLHRSEGLGLTMLEAMACGKPCIGTAYSGNLAFMTDSNSWLIPYTRTPVGPGSLYYPAHHEWAEPDVAAAAHAMREVFTDREKTNARATQGQADILANHSLQTVGEQLVGLLKLSATRAPRAKEMEIDQGQHRSEAYKALEQVRKIEDELNQLGGGSALLRGTLRRLRSEMVSLSKQQRKAISNTIRALRYSESKQQEKLDRMQRSLDRLAHQIEEITSMRLL